MVVKATYDTPEPSCKEYALRFPRVDEKPFPRGSWRSCRLPSPSPVPFVSFNGSSSVSFLLCSRFHSCSLFRLLRYTSRIASATVSFIASSAAKRDDSDSDFGTTSSEGSFTSASRTCACQRPPETWSKTRAAYRYVVSASTYKLREDVFQVVLTIADPATIISALPSPRSQWVHPREIT